MHRCCDACSWSVDMFHENRQSGQMWILPETPFASSQEQPVEKPPQKYICQLDPLEGTEEPKMRDASIMVKCEEAPVRSKVEEDAPAVDPNLDSWIDCSVPATCARSAKLKYHEKLSCARRPEAIAPIGAYSRVKYCQVTVVPRG